MNYQTFPQDKNIRLNLKSGSFVVMVAASMETDDGMIIGELPDGRLAAVPERNIDYIEELANLPNML